MDPDAHDQDIGVTRRVERHGRAHRPDLRSLEQRIEELEADNARLKESARTFGELAERLNNQLREERRRGNERRQRHPASSEPHAKTADDASASN